MKGTSVRLISAVISDRGLSEKRPVNEDSFLALVDRGLFAVADGVGGANAGEFASQTAMEVLHDAFSHEQPDIDPEELLEMAIQRANESINQMSQELPQFEMMATTIVTLQINGNIATIGHVGDSRLYRLSPNGELARETNDHSIVAEEVRAGRMTEAQAANHPSRNVISRALGAESAVEVELRTIMFEPGTQFLLCSDGITRHVTDNEIKSVLTVAESPDAACEEFKRMCYERGAEDNLTALVVRTEKANARIFNQIDEDENTVLGDRAASASVWNEEPEVVFDDTLKPDANPRANLSADETAPIADYNYDTALLHDLPVIDIADNLQSNPTKTLESAAHSSSILPSAVLPPAETVAETEPNTTQKLVDSPADTDIFREPELKQTTAPVAAPPAAKIAAPIVAPTPVKTTAAPVAAKTAASNLWIGSLLLFVGAALGAGLIYALTMLNPPAANAPAANLGAADSRAALPQATAPPTLTISPATTAPNGEQPIKQQTGELNTLETMRRTVDSQPRNVNSFVAQPQTAVDFYLIGRAALQIGEYGEARRAFERATRLIPELDNANQETLRVDVATAQAALSVLTKTPADARPLNELIKNKQQ